MDKKIEYAVEMNHVSKIYALKQKEKKKKKEYWPCYPWQMRKITCSQLIS